MELVRLAVQVGLAEPHERIKTSFKFVARPASAPDDPHAGGRDESVPPRGDFEACRLHSPDIQLRSRFLKFIGLRHEKGSYEKVPRAAIHPKA